MGEISSSQAEQAVWETGFEAENKSGAILAL